MAEGTWNRTEVADLLQRHGLVPKKRLGQHFLVDPNIVQRIVRLLASPPGTPVVEVGAGTGALTVALADAGYPVVAFEIDAELEPALREVIGARTGIELRFEDAGAADLHLAGRWALAGNLPYNVGTGILLDAIRREPALEELVVMVQREVADRLVAAPGSKTYGLPSVVAQLHCDTSLAFRVPPQVFLPVPRVGSAVVRMLRTAPPSPLLARACDLAAAAFGQRRKMLRGSLQSVLVDPAAALERAGLAGSERAEQLTPADYVSLALAATVDE